MVDKLEPLWYRRNGEPIWPMRGGDGTDDNPDGAPDGDGDGGDGNVDPPPAAILSAPEAVRNSPEFKELVRQNRKLARQAGASDRAATAARADAEKVRQAAEAQQQAALEAEIVGELGEEGVALWEEFSELTATDPAGAARLLASALNKARGQTPDPTQAGAGGEGAPAAGGIVPAQTPPPPSRGVDGSVPLGVPSTQQDEAQLIVAMDANVERIANRVQDPLTRNRVTMKERGEGFINFLAARSLEKLAERRAQR
jgi:hypothetical protein